jgi:hypothetical protein
MNPCKGRMHKNLKYKMSLSQSVGRKHCGESRRHEGYKGASRSSVDSKVTRGTCTHTHMHIARW